MNGGPTSPREADYFTCQVERCGDTMFDDDEVTSCFHAGCYKHVLCVGCSFDCVDCTDKQGHTFCAEHICQTPAENGMVEYRCVPCQAIHDKLARKAA